MRVPTQRARTPIQRTPAPLARPALLVLPALLALLIWTLTSPVSPRVRRRSAPSAHTRGSGRPGCGHADAGRGGEFTLGNARRLAGLPVPPEMRRSCRGRSSAWSLGSSVVSLSKTAPTMVRWGVFLASSDDPETLTILDGSLGGGDRAAFNYINSGGRDSEYVFIGGRTYLRKNDGSWNSAPTPPAGRLGHVTHRRAHPQSPNPPPPTGWNLGYLAGAAGVLILIPVFVPYAPRPPRPPSPRA